MQPTDGLERSHLRRMLTLLSSPSDPCAREHFTPGHFTASAFVLNPAQDSLLLIFHGKLARWLQPGGHVDPADMDVLAAARRELSEEVGLSDLPLVRPAIFDVDVHDIPARGRTPVHAHFDVRFLFQAHDEGCRAGSDAQDARWFRLDEIDAALSDPSVLRAVRKILTAP